MKRITLGSALAIATLATSACVTSPYDGENIASSPTTIIPKISGYGTADEQTVDIYAKDASGNFQWVTDTETGGIGWTWDGSQWWAWSITNYNLASQYWHDKPGGCGKTATLKATIGGYNAVSVDQEYADCFDLSQNTSEFLAACQSANSPEITIDTCGALCC